MVSSACWFIDDLLTVLERTNSSPNAREETGDGPSLNISAVHSRPFSSSSGSGHTTWQTVDQQEPIPHPPPNLEPNIGQLFIHRNPSTKTQTCWMYGKDGTWGVVSEGAQHPFLADRVLQFRPKSNDDPSWNTRATVMTTRARRERQATPSSSV